jgi:hypothetical protein
VLRADEEIPLSQGAVCADAAPIEVILSLSHQAIVRTDGWECR